MQIVVSDFVQRQTAESRFSHFNGPWSEVVKRTHAGLSFTKDGYRDGVVLVPILNTEGFFSGVATLNPGDQLIGRFEARREGETPRQSVSVVGRAKLPAKSVYAVLYRADVLAEDPSHVPKGDWEIVSLNASPEEGEMPIDPMTLMHNHFGSTGGTATGLNDTDFVVMLRQSFEFWKDKAFVQGA